MSVYSVCVAESLNYDDRDAFVSDLALSSIWEDAEDAQIPQERIEWLGGIWDASHRSPKDIAKAAKLSQRALAERFCVPQRTMEDWCRGVSKCPVYTKLMMQECLGLFDRILKAPVLKATDLQVLLSTGMSEHDAKRHLKNGTAVFESVDEWANAQKANGYWNDFIEEAETDDPRLMIERLGDREITGDGHVIEYVL